MKNQVSPVTFHNKDALKLFGMLHLPDEDKRNGIGVVLLPPGVKARVGPHRLYRHIANMLSNSGFLVLRFDFHGIGDSEGDIAEEYLADYYGSVSMGRHIDDTVSALDWLEENYNISRFILGGLCGGAITGILAAHGDSRVIGLIGLGLPVVVDGANIDKSNFITKGQLQKLGKGYIKKLFKPKAWIRFLTFRSDYKIIVKAFKQVLGITKTETQKVVSPTTDAIKNSDPIDNYNPMFDPAFFNMIKNGQKIILVFSGADRLAWEFNEKFVSRFNDKIESINGRYEMHIIKNANHILSDKKWQNEMFDIISTWLSKNGFTQNMSRQAG